MKKRTWTLVILSLLFLSIGVLLLVKDQQVEGVKPTPSMEPTQKIMTLREKVERIGKELSGRALLSGTIVDENGDPVTGVNISISAPTGGGNVGMSGTVDGSFSHEMNQVNLIDLRLWKDGHEPFSVHYNVRNEGIKVSGQYFLDRSNLVIRLPHITPGSAPIQKFEVSFANNINELSNKTQYVKERRIRDTVNLNAGFIKGINKFSELQEHGITILPVYNGEEIPMSSDVDKFGRKIKKVDNIEIQVLNENDGLVLHSRVQTNGSISLEPEKVFRQMSEAPESGYKRKIELEGNYSREIIYAYFYIDGKYGKLACSIDNVRMTQKSQYLHSTFLLMVQQDGSRNIAGWVK